MAWVVVLIGVVASGIGFIGARALGRARALSAHREWSFAGQRVTAQAVAYGWSLEVHVEGNGLLLSSRPPGDVDTLRGPSATRDPVFDRLFKVDGALEARAILLDQRLRSSLIALAELGVVALIDGKLVVTSETVSDALAELLAGAALLLRADGLALRLRTAAAEDPLPEIREAALRALDARVGGDAHWLIAARDRSPEIRLRAAMQLGARGEPILWALAEDAGLERPLRARAAEMLVGPGAPAALTARALGIVLPHPNLAAMVARRLPSGRMPTGAVSLLAAALADRDASVRVSAITLLARHPAPDADSRLIPLLTDPHPDVRRAAVLALGAVGGPAAVHALYRMTDNGDVEGDLAVEIARSIVRCDPRGVVRR